MAQFVTHIQPTLVEASHHHVPHHHKDVQHKDHHPKEHHSKEHHAKESHHSKSDHHKEHSSYHHHHREHTEHYAKAYIRDFPVLPFVHHESTESAKAHPDSKDGGVYVDSHGLPHAYQMHFIDSQGIYRDYHGHGVDDEEKRKDVHDKSPGGDVIRPTPPKHIELKPFYPENKTVSCRGLGALG